MTNSPAALPEDADRILLVDDEATNLDVLRHALEGRGYRLFIARSGETAIEVARRVHPQLILLDIVMSGIDGYETCRRLKVDPETREAAVIFLSSLDDTKDKVRGLDVGAVDFVSKPFHGDELVARVNTHLTLHRLRRQVEARNAELARELAIAQELLMEARRRVEGSLLGDSPAVRALRESIARYAADADVVLLTGPQGAGHEAAARAIHHASPRSRQAFMHVNCAMVTSGQDPGILSPLAGVSEPGTGSNLSLLELATQGTLYLEEIQRLPGELQERLAAVLEGVQTSHESGQPAVPDVRFIAYTSAPLAEASGFHPKLLALVGRRQLRVPSLTERQEDVSDIALFFLRRHARRIGAVVETISEQSMKRLRKYRWPGDVRELQSVIERAVTSAREPVLEIDPALLDEGLPLGHYRLLGKLGEGGMGEVWRARHQLLARPCAIKLIKPDLLGREQAGRGYRTLSAGSADHRAIDLAEHGPALRFRRERDRQLLLRHGTADRHGRRITGAAIRAAPSGARSGRAAPGVPLSRRGACRGGPAPRHQTAESFLVPVGSRFRCREGPGLWTRQIARRRGCPAHDRRRSDRDTRLYATRACHGRGRRRAIRPVLARLRGLLDADRPRGIHRGADDRDDPSCSDRSSAPIEGFR